MSNYDGERVLVDKGGHNTAYSHIWENENIKWFFFRNIFFLQVKVCDPPKSYLPPAPRCRPLLSSFFLKKNNSPSVFFSSSLFESRHFASILRRRRGHHGQRRRGGRGGHGDPLLGDLFRGVSCLTACMNWSPFSGGRPAATCGQACWRCHPRSAQVGWP